MNINEKIITLLQSEPESEQKYCVINGRVHPLADIEGLGYNEFAIRTKTEMPDKLYKFFPNSWTTEQISKKPVNYSLQSLRDNTVYLSNPEQFDDIYDSDMNISWEDYLKHRLRIYCIRCKCDICESATVNEMLLELIKAFFAAYEATKDLKSAFSDPPQIESEHLTNQIFTQSIKIELGQGEEWHNAVLNALKDEYSDYKRSIRNTFRISCFTTYPYSQLMWGGAYADCHRGFCVEYQVDRTSDQFKEAYYNLFPVIYCKSRPDMTERLAKFRDGEFTTERMWDIYFHGALRKSADWVQQNEWRLLLPLGNKRDNYSVPFFQISKVFLGNRMDKNCRAEIIDICHQRDIHYVGVRRTDSIFEMKDCDVLCENCPSYLS